jgi:O-antigen ligase
MNFHRSFQPLILAISILSGFWYIDSALTGLLLIITAATACRTSFLSHTGQNYSLTLPMLAYLVWLFIVTFSSAIPNTSMMTLAVLAGLPISYLAASNSPNITATWSPLRMMLFLGSVSLAIWGLWQVVAQIGYGFPVGPLVDRNAFAALMNLLWFPATYLFLINTSSRLKAIFFGSGLFIINMALFATASRGGIATWLLLLPILLWAGWRCTHAKWWVAAIPLIAIAAYIASMNLGADTNIANRSFALSQDASTGARLLLWQSAIQMTWAHPFTGTGWGTFAGIYPAFRSPLENTTAGVFAHNDYLQLAAEGGVIAPLLLLLILFGILWQLRRSVKLSHTAAGLESTTLLLGVLAIFIHAGVNFIFYFAFMNIIAGLYLARAAQLTETPRIITLPSLAQISKPIKRMMAGFIILLVAAPFVLHLIAQACLTGSQPGLKALNAVAPNINAYDIAKLITAIRPQEGIAQEVMLQVTEAGLADSAGISMTGGNFQRELLNEALDRFDQVRAQTANNPNMGVREVKILISHHTALPAGLAYAKAHSIITANLKADPYHANSYIALARLQVAEGHRADAINTLQQATHHVLSRRDQQLLNVETLRQLAAPKIIPELDEIEKKLHTVRSDSETGKPLILAPHFSEDIDARLQAIANGLNVVPK